jgi:hypothetical protein
MRVFGFVLAAVMSSAVGFACGRGGSAGPDAIDPRFVLPGDYSERTTVVDLQRRFGAANVRVTTEPDGVGGNDSLLVLFPEDPTRRATVRFHSGGFMGPLASITVTEPGSRWRGKHGVRVGMSLTALRATNGRPFHFYGLDSLGRGTVRDSWDVGALDVEEPDHLYLGVDLIWRARDATVVRPGESEAVSIDDPAWAHIGELVEVSAILAWSSLDDEWSGVTAAPHVPELLAATRR